MKSEKETLLIFDLDGVLVDSEPLAARIFVQCLQKDGFDVDEEYGLSFRGIALRDCLEQVENDFKRTVSEGFTESLTMLTNEEIKCCLDPIPNVEKALANLPQPKCVASGSDHTRIRLSLEVTGLSNYFPHIFSATDVLRGKPAPDIFLHAANVLNVRPENCFVIEDSKAGMIAGLAAGMKVLLYRPSQEESFPVPNEVTIFSDMIQLPELIQQESSIYM